MRLQAATISAAFFGAFQPRHLQITRGGCLLPSRTSHSPLSSPITSKNRWLFHAAHNARRGLLLRCPNVRPIRSGRIIPCSKIEWFAVVRIEDAPFFFGVEGVFRRAKCENDFVRVRASPTGLVQSLKAIHLHDEARSRGNIRTGWQRPGLQPYQDECPIRLGKGVSLQEAFAPSKSVAWQAPQMRWRCNQAQESHPIAVRDNTGER